MALITLLIRRPMRIIVLRLGHLPVAGRAGLGDSAILVALLAALHQGDRLRLRVGAVGRFAMACGAGDPGGGVPAVVMLHVLRLPAPGQIEAAVGLRDGGEVGTNALDFLREVLLMAIEAEGGGRHRGVGLVVLGRVAVGADEVSIEVLLVRHGRSRIRCGAATDVTA